jgi:putative transcription factor
VLAHPVLQYSHPPPPSLYSTSVSTELKKRIMQARLAKKMTQAQLAQAINEKPQVIQEYESGKAIPNGAILNKLSRVLGVGLSKKGGK